MRADEFSKWLDVLDSERLYGDDKLTPLGERAVQAIDAEIEASEYAPPTVRAAKQYADAIKWAAFWISVGTVTSVAIYRLA